MNINKINSYISLEVLKTFTVILLTLSIIAWTARAVNFLDLIVENGLSFSTYLAYSILNLTNIITKFIPLSFLIALFLSILKFQRNNEFIILWTMGMSKVKLLNLFVRLSIFVLFLQLFFSVFLNPLSLNTSRLLIAGEKTTSFNSIIKTNDFSDNFDNITFFIQKKNDKNEMENIFISDKEDALATLSPTEVKENEDISIFASRGYFEGLKLILLDGSIQTLTKKKEIKSVNFKKTEITLDKLNTRVIKQPKIQETSTINLLSCIGFKKNKNSDLNIFNCSNKDLNNNVIENLNRRIGMPFYIPILPIIISFLLIADVSRKRLKQYLIFSLGFIILTIAEILLRYSSFSYLNTFFYFLFPFTLAPILYLYLLFKFVKEKKLKYD